MKRIVNFVIGVAFLCAALSLYLGIEDRSYREQCYQKFPRDEMAIQVCEMNKYKHDQNERFNR